ncbi:hypothetical protein [Propionicimonas sp.]|uniref:hypothetical protein n=1 Tax=Propionicimonas sp. TaxID=1955623 RepID=UPI0039E44435
MERLISATTAAGGLGTPGARWAFVFGWSCGVLQGAVDGSLSRAPLLWAVALAAGLIGVLALTTPGDRDLSAPVAGATVGIAGLVAVTALVTAGAVGDVWGLDLAAYLATFLIVRGNLVAGLVGGLLVPGVAAVWAVPQEPSLEQWALLLGIPVGCLVAASAWRLVLRWMVGQERRHRSAAARAAERAEADAAALAATRDELASIGVDVTPLLERLCAGEPVDAGLRAELAFVEADVRDRIRAPHLRHPVLVSAVASLRQQGVEVVLLGEASGAGSGVSDGLAMALATAVAQVREGRVTIRALPQGRPAAASVVTSDAGGSSHREFSAAGALLDAADALLVGN